MIHRLSNEKQYRTEWQPRQYLDQYYSTQVTRDDIANARFAFEQLRALGRRFSRVLEVGCGPTVHHVAPLLHWVERVTLADLLPSNLAEIRLWLDCKRGAFDWDPWLRSTLAAVPELAQAISAEVGTKNVVERCKARIRNKVGELRELDLLDRTPPVVCAAGFDLVVSYYCAECVGPTRSVWLDCLRRLAEFVAPGGVLLLGVMRQSSSYRVAQTAFPVAPVDETDLRHELPQLGFPPAKIAIETAEVPEFAEYGFHQVIGARAIKLL
jgi:SAM-dependent methyltransferase